MDGWLKVTVIIYRVIILSSFIFNMDVRSHL